MYDFVFIGAHPDDVILSCGGMVAKLCFEGYTCMILSLTAGENGNASLGDIRKQELLTSAKLLGADCYCLDFCDTALSSTTDAQSKIKDLLKAWNPRFLFWHNPLDPHPDHGIVNELMLKSIFLLCVSSNNAPPRLCGCYCYQIVKVTALTITRNNFDVYCDISNQSALKQQAIREHVSQAPHIKNNEEAILAYNTFLGKLNGCIIAEGYTSIPLDYGIKLQPIEKFVH